MHCLRVHLREDVAFTPLESDELMIIALPIKRLSNIVAVVGANHLYTILGVRDHICC